MYKAILHATDLAKDHFALCQKAQAIAKCFDADFYLMHVVTLPSALQLAQGLGFAEIEPLTPMIKDAESVLRILGESLKIPTKHLFVEAGPITELIFNKIKTLKCELLIIGQHIPTFLDLGLNNISQSIVHDSQCDVLTVY